jgi:hypothetical protein
MPSNEWSSSEIEKVMNLFKEGEIVAFMPEKQRIRSADGVESLRKLYFNMLPL